MTIRQQGGVFGRNPEFTNVTIDGDLTVAGSQTNTGVQVFNGNVGINTTPTAQLELKNTGNLKFYTDSTGGYIKQDVSRFDLLHFISIGQIKYISDPNNSTIYTAHIFECDGGEVSRFTPNGLTFNGDTAAANALDDYEEGTWTPAVAAGAITGTGITYTGTYTKIGRNVTLFFNANSATSDIAVASYVVFSGLPFTVTGNIGSGTMVTEDVDATSRQGFVGLGASSLFVGACGGGTTSDLYCSITYYTS